MLSAYPVPGPAVVAALAEGPATQVALAVAAERLTARLRTSEGLSYAVETMQDAWTASCGLGGLSCDCSESDSATVWAVMVEELDRLVASGPTAQEIAWFHDKGERSLRDEKAVVSEAAALARCTLTGAPYLTPEAWLSAIEALDPAAVGSTLQPLVGEGFWLVAFETEVDDDRFEWLCEFSEHRAEGKGWRSIYDETRLYVDETHVSVGLPIGIQLTQVRDELVGVKRWSDGAVTFYGRASSFGVQGTDYTPAGSAALEGFMTTVDPRLVVNGNRPWRDEAELAELTPRLRPIGRLLDRIRT